MAAVRATELRQTIRRLHLQSNLIAENWGDLNSFVPVCASGKPACRCPTPKAILYLPVLDQACQIARHGVDVEGLFPEVNVLEFSLDGGPVVAGCEHERDIAGA